MTSQDVFLFIKMTAASIIMQKTKLQKPHLNASVRVEMPLHGHIVDGMRHSNSSSLNSWGNALETNVRGVPRQQTQTSTADLG
jgi:hypothetical protein